MRVVRDRETNALLFDVRDENVGNCMKCLMYERILVLENEVKELKGVLEELLRNFKFNIESGKSFGGRDGVDGKT